MQSVTSQDGTRIAYETLGTGPSIMLVDGAFGYRAFGPNPALAKLLADYFTVTIYDRRGRGDSVDRSSPYHVEREVEDIAALIEAVGGVTYLYGISSGAVLALEAAKRLLNIKKLIIYEAPLIVDHSRSPISASYAQKLTDFIQNDEPGKAIKLFMREGVEVPAIGVLMVQLMPAWKQMMAVAHTLLYDTALTEQYQKGHPLQSADWKVLTIPTRVIVGGKSPTWMQNGMNMLAATLPNAQHEVLPGQTHILQAKAIVPSIVEFLKN